MIKLNKLLTGIFFLPLITLSLNTHADDNVRIHGGISVDTGNLHFFISDRQPSSHSYVDRYVHYNSNIDRRSDRYRSQLNYRHNERRYNNHSYDYRSYNHNDNNRSYNPKQHSNKSHHRRDIVIRDSGLSDYRKFRHQRSYNHWYYGQR